jgi:hypothetical protein
LTEHIRTRLHLSLLALLVAAVPLALFGGGTPLRAVVVFAALLLVPGGALLTLLPVGRLPEWLSLAVCLSLAIDVAGSLTLIWSHWWHPEVLAVALAVLSGAALLASLVRTGSFGVTSVPEGPGHHG